MNSPTTTPEKAPAKRTIRMTYTALVRNDIMRGEQTLDVTGWDDRFLKNGHLERYLSQLLAAECQGEYEPQVHPESFDVKEFSWKFVDAT